MSLYQHFKTNQSVETKGIWVQYGVAKDGKPVQFRIARAGGSNTAYLKALESATAPYRKQIEIGALDPEVATKIMHNVFAKCIVLDWENVTDENGELLEYTTENVIKVFTDLPDLFIDIQKVAHSLAAFREEQNQADLGN